MERRRFVRQCGICTVAIPLGAVLLPSCGSIHYATAARKGNRLSVARSEFVEVTKNRQRMREFVLIDFPEAGFPICLYRQSEDDYLAALMKCTHRGCELNVGAGIYACPCHGSEFSINGTVLNGPAEHDLQVYQTLTDDTHVYIQLV
ncbi:MAG: Rieske (2Fe-2S) protein [Saprospiraceae bacterium]|nr:Rieske (2Fe-2S) protein [Saprospiraceae bacterium]